MKLSESRRAVAGQDDVTDARHRQQKMKTARNRVDHMLKRLNEQVCAVVCCKQSHRMPPAVMWLSAMRNISHPLDFHRRQATRA